jgi:phosphoglycerol geranylgeranyltransferase
MGPVEEWIRQELDRLGRLCFALIDSLGIDPDEAASRARRAELCGVSGILVGGSTATDQMELDTVVRRIKEVVTKPVILFPGNVTGISPNADAIFFSSLLNSEDPYFITGAQALGAPVVRKYGLEAIPMGYLIVGEGGSTGFVGRARPIPVAKSELAAMYALAAQYLGMRFLYVEAGSGAAQHAPKKLISAVRSVYEGVLIVGGGLRRPEDVREVAEGGADIVVVGTLIESEGFEPILKMMIDVLREVRR